MDTEHLAVTTSDGAQLAATRRRGAGRSVVLLHAGVADRRSWDGVVEALAPDDLDLVAYDRRGHGATPAAGDPSAFTHVDDLVAVLDGLRIDEALLVGNSMGGAPTTKASGRTRGSRRWRTCGSTVPPPPRDGSAARHASSSPR